MRFLMMRLLKILRYNIFWTLCIDKNKGIDYYYAMKKVMSIPIFYV